MVLYRYNAQMDPPAPFVHVSVRHTERDVELTDLPAQLDTAADLTVLPKRFIEQLGLVPIEAMQILGFDGEIVDYDVYGLEVAIRDLGAMLVKVISSSQEPYILLGRDVLNHFRVVMDGRNLSLEID